LRKKTIIKLFCSLKLKRYVKKILATLWAIYATYKTIKMCYLGKFFINQIKTFVVNFLLFPYCLYYDIKFKKF